MFAEGGYDPHEPFSFEGRTASRGASQAIFADKAQIYYPKGLQQQEHPESVCRSVMIRLGDHKLVRRTSGVNELYDLRRDPRELRNLYADPSHAQTRADLEQRLLDWTHPHLGRRALGREPPGPAAPQVIPATEAR